MMEMGDSSESLDSVRERIRGRLNEEKVRLWLEPYTLTDGVSRGETPTKLIESYSEALAISTDVVAAVIEELRCHACNKLLQRQNSVRVRVKLAGDLNNIPHGSDGGVSGERSVDILLSQTGQDLKQLIAKMSGVVTSELKLIVSGRVVRDEISLRDQNVKSGALVMALRVAGESNTDSSSSSSTSQSAEAQSQEILTKTRQAAEFLSRNVKDGATSLGEDYSIQIADQTGKPIDIPVDERKALTLAMMLHERGRSTLKRRLFSLSLPLLLEADVEFKKCRADILKAVDNYAVLCLDIVWCYLCLHNISALPDAEVRLKASEEGFRRCYGPNVERLELVKGGTAKEKALFARLHLLQGVLAFHQNRTHTSRQLLTRAQNELNLLKVDENAMTQVMEMGFSGQEARLGLRACAGDIQAAVLHIMSQRQRRKELTEEESKEREKKRMAKKLGKTANGELVNVDYYKSLLAMGYAKGGACEALKQSNNDIITAIQILSENPELLTLPDPYTSSSSVAVTQEMIESVAALGFDPVSVETALKFFGADVDRTVEGLISNGGLATQEWLDAVQAMSNQLIQQQQQQHRAGGSTSRSSSSVEDVEEEGGGGVEGLTRRECERMIDEEIRQDISSHEEDYLDLDLLDEESLLNEYQALLSSSSSSSSSSS